MECTLSQDIFATESNL